ncbi:SPOR domain-containing protein [Candidatus Magnetobacterium casense]|uniref:SPOR domain-containing protein n=1 Tax=Candidatus Magnetobacterium casense TaxID=1455061 RepID=UPI00058CB07E|nr:SPOR domain-containing protein [Candidatus Magnetobacterium casensis]
MSDSSIIVIDDDKNNSQQISEILRQEGYTVYSTTTKAESVAQVKKNPPGLIFVKSMLMDASGYEIIRDIRSTHPDIPFIMLTEIDKRYDDRYRTIYKIVDTVRIPVEREDLLEKTRIHIVDANDMLNETAPYDPDIDDVATEKASRPLPQYEQEQEEEEVHPREDDSSGHREKAGLFELEEVSYQNDRDTQDAEGFGQDTQAFAAESAEDTPDFEENPRLAALRQKRERFDFEEEINRQNKDYAEDITTLEHDEEEFIRSLKEKNAKKKRLIAGIVAAVFVVIVGVVYMFAVKDGQPAKGKKPLIAQKATPQPIVPVVKPTPQQLPVVVATPAPVAATPEPLNRVTPEPPKQQRITPEYVEPEEVKVPPKEQVQQQRQAQKSPKAVPDKPKPKDKAVVTKESKPHKAAKPVKEDRQKAPEEPVDTAQEAYTIQLGSFADPSNAKRLKESLKKEGYSAYVREFPPQSGQDVAMHKVFVGRYKNKADALKTVNKLKGTKNVDLILKKM